MGELFTIGHSKHTPDDFVALLRKYNVNYVLDVRSTPYSKYAEQFNKENVVFFLDKVGIQYSFMGKYFGARPDEEFLYGEDGCLDFEKVVQTERFNTGMQSVILGLERENRIALMCTEKYPIDCHRAIMVSRAFDKKGIKVSHILPDGAIETQKDLDNRLLNLYFPDRDQLTIFDYANLMDEEDYITQAYRKRNQEIGYRIGKKVAMAI